MHLIGDLTRLILWICLVETVLCVLAGRPPVPPGPPIKPRPTIPQPPSPYHPVHILRYENDHQPNGAYNFAYQLSDGTAREETGHVINSGTENEAIAVRGSFSYLAPNGVTYTVNYVADENGFQPQGEHIPPAPPPTLRPFGPAQSG